MAGEILYNITFQYANGAYNLPAVAVSTGSDSADIASTQPGPFERNVVTVTTSSTAIPATLIGTLGMALLHNCDSAISINVYPTAGDTNALLTLKPGEWQLVRFATTSTPAVKVASGTALLEYFLVGN
jgi:hypothetical protein